LSDLRLGIQSDRFNDPALYRCHVDGQRDNYVRVHAYGNEHAQRQASIWLGVEPGRVRVARTESGLLSLGAA
jgi:hypothetical protein